MRPRTLRSSIGKCASRGSFSSGTSCKRTVSLKLSSRALSHSSYLTKRLIISRCLTLTASFSLSHSHCSTLIASLSLPLLQGTLVRSRLVACCCWLSSEYHCRSTRRDFEATSERDRVVQTPIECIATCAKNSRTCSSSSTEQRQC